ncbi:hypothetical protein Nepgr_017314 [Nepenthes gracilis]|uniref:Uncharacterized protein n=1 Tax=Nepenthes gracilis TaxID=150966 RepID=A0AAD3SQ66_NEPGR|nr:hypothetical protein Nepgr_017314 [Nepenthes gracilis]
MSESSTQGGGGSPLTVNQTGTDVQKSEILQSGRPVIYGASPAKVVQNEQESSTEGEESSYSSEEDRPSAERRRTLIRSATPRRSASPMRRIQVGRSGLHRAPAVNIRNLNYFPSGERPWPYRDAAPNGCQAEESELTNKNPECDVKRMSVQDTINLFESKQSNQAADIQKRRSLIDSSASTHKFVLRRWNAGMGDPSAPCVTPNAPECTTSWSGTNLRGEDSANKTVEIKVSVSPDSGVVEAVKTAKAGEELEISDRSIPNPTEVDIPVCQADKTDDRLDQAEWNQKKEAELNEMLMKLVETKPIRINYQSTEPDSSENLDPYSQQRGGLYNQYKETRDEKLDEKSGKKSEKQAHYKATQKSLEKTEAKMSSRTASNSGKKHPVNKTQKVVKNLPQASNSKNECPEPAGQKKASPKASSLSSTRKSWPSTPSPKAIGESCAKSLAGISSSGSAASHQKSQSSASISCPTPKVERLRLQQKDVGKFPVDTKKGRQRVNDNMQQMTTNGVKTMKKGFTAPNYNTDVLPLKPRIHSRTFKKSSMVPLESKPSAQYATAVSPLNSLMVDKTEVPSQAEEPVCKREKPDSVQEDEIVANASDLVSPQIDKILTAQEKNNTSLEPETQVARLPNFANKESLGKISVVVETIERFAGSPAESQHQEEPVISHASCVENCQQDLPIPSSNSASSQLVSPTNLAAMEPSGARVRHPLSQMLLEESSEPDISEWGAAENPPMVYQKDVPKGLKRLLNFSWQSKGETNVAGWSGPCTSEGEDNVDDKSFSKRNNDSLLWNSALHEKKYGEQGTISEAFERNFSDKPLSARSNTGNNSAQSSNKFQQPNVSSSSSTKATKSFFSVSAFRGNKATETRLR